MDCAVVFSCQIKINTILKVFGNTFQSVYLCAWACMHMSAVPMDTRRGHQIPRSRNYMRLWGTMWVVGTKLWFSERTVRVFNHWVISSPWKIKIEIFVQDLSFLLGVEWEVLSTRVKCSATELYSQSLS